MSGTRNAAVCRPSVRDTHKIRVRANVRNNAVLNRSWCIVTLTENICLETLVDKKSLNKCSGVKTIASSVITVLLINFEMMC